MATRYLTKIGMFSLAKITGVIYALMGFIFGALITLTSLLGGSMMGNEGVFPGMILGAGAIIALPIFYGIIGFIGGIITALIFNIATRFLGGLEIEVE
jgi:hypothetical protein